MKTFAIIDDNRVTRLVVADSIAILGALLPDEDLVLEVTDATGAAYIGAEYRKDKFVPFNNYTSWTWDEDAWAWQSPIPYPQDGKFYGWDNEAESWIEIKDVPDTIV